MASLEPLAVYDVKRAVALEASAVESGEWKAGLEVGKVFEKSQKAKEDVLLIDLLGGFSLQKREFHVEDLCLLISFFFFRILESLSEGKNMQTCSERREILIGFLVDFL